MKLAINNDELISDDPLTVLAKSHSIHTWSELLHFTKQLPYGRNQNREDFSLVLKELKGTCSSKHAFLQRIADLNQIGNVKLILGMYKMNQSNTPKIGTTIAEAELEYIPEAHCYLKVNNRMIDVTTDNSEFDKIRADLLEEIEIEPEQVNAFKVEYHKAYIKKWIQDNSIPMDFDRIWEIRETCIQRLAE